MSTTFRATSKSAKAPVIAGIPGIFYARFTGVEAKDLPNSQFDPEAFIWSFDLLDDDFEQLYNDDADPITVDKVTSQNLNTKAKTTPGAVKVLKALLTSDEFTDFEARAEVDQNDEDALALFDKKHPPVKDEDLIGRIVQLGLDKKENGWPLVEEVTRTKQPKAAK